MQLTSIKVRTNSRVRQALARRYVFVEEFTILDGVLERNDGNYLIYLPECDLNVFLRRSTCGRCSFYAIGTGKPAKLEYNQRGLVASIGP
mgnify:CR=1 FL=1